MSTLKKPMVVALLSCAVLSCGREHHSSNSAQSGQISAQLKTDLGYLGNSRAQRRFEDYINNKNSGCTATGPKNRRVLVSGFGPFNRSPNISGAVVQLLQNSELWPESAGWSTTLRSAPRFTPDDSPGSLGARAVQRTIRFENDELELCLVNTSVEWDLAAAIVMHEANNFRPDFILMTGYGTHPTGMRIEHGAINKTSQLSGYDPTGRYLTGVNTPESDWIAPPALGLPATIEMNWNTHTIAHEVAPDFDRLNRELTHLNKQAGFHPVAMTAADPLNNYVCNNISYAIAASFRLPSVPLAGNRIRVQTTLNRRVKFGFAHYPNSINANSPDEVWIWAHMALALTQATQMN
ncbi:MAG: hypothetical protein RJB13_2496 [Pseudomonadota bacterium]